ncbi:hypothetical protein [Dokdonella sp.]|uniref:hypothetical protein n=1 Tax=Dokdonella sp. TaxID=2291710 RepID=UPI001B109FF6|nr:hypothetical protein [Dokdonella sp.]MBO9662626.1 hypothetical protein [Dokdonella sp.]
MRSFSVLGAAKLAVLLAVAVAMSACSWFGGGSKSSGVVKQAENIPAGFDVTLVAAKDNQFDLNDVPLTPQDLESAFRHRTQEEKLPLTTVLLKRGEKQKVKKEHEATLVRIARQMNFKAYVQESDGVISELQARGE